MANEFQYSQTVESVEESSSKFKRPPISKRKSVGKKKESSLSRSKDHERSQHNIISESASFEPAHPKFDSNVYESQYEESVEMPNRGKMPPEIVLNRVGN